MIDDEDSFFPRDPRFVRRLASEIGSRLQRYHTDGDVSLPPEMVDMLDQLERAEARARIES